MYALVMSRTRFRVNPHSIVSGSSPVAVTYTSDFTPALSREFLDMVDCSFTNLMVLGSSLVAVFKKLLFLIVPNFVVVKCTVFEL